MASSYLNAHLVRLWSNIRALDTSNTLQKASDKQWGVVRFAKPEDIFSDDGNKMTVISNDVLNRTIKELKEKNKKEFQLDGVLDFSKSYQFRRGEFSIGLGENKAVKITSNPELVAFSNISLVPVGFDEIPFFTAKSVQSEEEIEKSDITSGIVNFSEKETPNGYEEFHAYYHKSGYVICRNGKYNNSQGQMRIVWTLFERKT